MDGEFEYLRPKLAEMSVTLNTTSRDEHVPEAERRIRVIKERVRAIWNTLPFERMPARMVIEMVYSCNFWLNCFPATDGISDTLSLRAIVDGTNIDFKKHCRVQFGDYVQTHEPHDNSMVPHTTGAIALRPTGNDQGGHYFYSLTSGKTPLPIRTMMTTRTTNPVTALPAIPTTGVPTMSSTAGLLKTKTSTMTRPAATTRTVTKRDKTKEWQGRTKEWGTAVRTKE
jgi:hypothetical protein